MARIRFSIAGIVILGLVAAATLLLGIVGYAGYQSFCARQREEFHHAHAMLADQLAASLVLPLWNFDREQIGKVIESAMQEESIYRVEVRPRGEVSRGDLRARDAAWGIIASGTAPVPAELPVERRAITMAGEAIGEVRIVATEQFLQQQLRRTGNTIVGAIALLDAMVVAGLYVLLWSVVLRPLRELEQHALAVSSGRGVEAMPAARPAFGELASLRQSIENMIALLQARYADATKSEQQQRLLAESLRESEEKFSKAFRSGPDAMAIAEVDTGRYLDVNEGFERLYGYSRAEAIGRTSLELGTWQSPADRDAFITLLRTKGAVREMEIVSANRRGERIIYLMSAECMVLGGKTCVVSATHDITDRTRAEAERAEAVAREVKAREEFTRRLIAAQEAERRRIAGELHDSLGQNLLLVKNRAQLALAGGNIPADQRWQFESIHDMATQAIAEVRQISHDLRPYQLDQLGLTRALEAMIDAAARNTGFPFDRKIEPVDDVFAGEAATHLYRIVQESLNNVLKHSRANRARVLLERDVRHVRLWIEDNGCGFPPDGTGPAEGGFGLKNIAERARILGGGLKIDSTLGGGTRLELILNLPDGT